MALTRVHCPTLGAHVSRVTNLEDEVTELICPEYVRHTGICRLKEQAEGGGPLAQLLERVSEDGLTTRGTKCELGPHAS